MLAHLQHDWLNNPICCLAPVEVKWTIPCFLMWMLTIDKLFICIKCNNSSLWFLLFGNIWNFWRKEYRLLSHAKKKKKSCYQQKSCSVGQKHNIVFSGTFLHKPRYLYYIICHVISPCIFLLSKASENQSLLMEVPLICPFLCSSTYPCSHCEFTSFYWNEPGEEVKWALHI